MLASDAVLRQTPVSKSMELLLHRPSLVRRYGAGLDDEGELGLKRG